ncbi:MAG TPA: hypothetical protein VJ323_13765, partial [Bryobacteraceae bacterium]|nr:hypothetical protein [Bryobacteraceae bacterium]
VSGGPDHKASISTAVALAISHTNTRVCHRIPFGVSGPPLKQNHDLALWPQLRDNHNLESKTV